MSSRHELELRALYERYAAVVHRRALQLLGDDGDAWDVVQTVFIGVFNTDPRTLSGGRPLAYLLRATTNASLNVLRARATQRRLEHGPGAPSPAEPAKQTEARELLMALSKHLDERQLNVAALHHVFGLVQEEIAEVVGLSRKTVGLLLAEVRRAALSLASEGRRDHG